MVSVAALGSECFAIKDDDQKNQCLAESKKDPSYCHKIKTQNLREACLAQLKGETYGCFKIQEPDARTASRSRARILGTTASRTRLGEVEVASPPCRARTSEAPYSSSK